MFRHLVLFRMRDGAGDAILGEAMTRLRAAGESSGVLSWTVAVSLDERKGKIVAQDGVFVDADAFHAWRRSRAHRETAEWMAERADWWVADWDPSAV